jgi:V/A-type H+-transporting ATPase subunit F
MEYKIAIIGSPQTILGFKAMGVEAFPISSVDEGEEVLQTIKLGQYAILLITEDWVVALAEQLEELKSQALPAVTVLPSQLGSLGLGYKELRKIVERAVGSDIFFKE